MHIVLIHGFNVSDGGAGTVDKLAPYLEAAGHTVDKDEADYGKLGFWKVRFGRFSAVRRITRALEGADVAISHSNGGNYANKALKALHGRGWYREVRISPALNRKTAAAENVARCTVFFTKSDLWVWLAGFLWFHPWGRQGQKGYKGTDPRMINLDFSDTVKGHSGWFDDDQVEATAKEIIEALK
jgi:hypothetical protein